MAELDDFRKMFLSAIANTAVGGMRAHEALTPEWVKPYKVPEIKQDTPPGKVGPGEMNLFERLIGGALDLGSPPGVKGAAILGPIGIRRLTGMSEKRLADWSKVLQEVQPDVLRDLWKTQGTKVGPGNMFHNPLENMVQMEVPDTGAKLLPKGKGFELQHPEMNLHDIYNIPPIEITREGFNKGDGGVFRSGTGEIVLNANPNAVLENPTSRTPGMSMKELQRAPVSAAVHEMHHGVAQKEKMASGFNPSLSPFLERFYKELYGSPFVEKPTPQQLKTITRLVDDAYETGAKNKEQARLQHIAQDVYQNVLGEAIPNALQRRWMVPELYRQPPLDTVTALTPREKLVMPVDYEYLLR